MIKFPFIFKLESKQLSIELILNGRLTFIDGNSGTGKTYMLKKIYALLKEPILRKDYKYNFNEKNVYVCLDKADLLDIYSKSNCIIFIDRFDFFINDKLLDFIKKSDNLFVLMCRGYGIDLKGTVNDVFHLESHKKGDKVYIRANHSI